MKTKQERKQFIEIIESFKKLGYKPLKAISMAEGLLKR